VPEELDAITARLLNKDPEARYPEASALVEDLERAKGGLPLDAVTRERRTAKRSGRGFGRRGLLAALALVVISVGVIAVVALNRDGVLLGEPRRLPEMNPDRSTSVPLSPGRYVTEEFEPALSFTIDKGVGWRLSYTEMFDNFELTTATTFFNSYPWLAFFRVHEVYTPNG
jgi:hypothetical protein